MVKVTDADREAAEEWRWMLYDPRDTNPVAEANDAVENLAEAFARHRIAGAKAALEKAAEAMRSVEPDTEAAGCEATWGDFQQVAEAAVRAIELWEAGYGK